MKIHIPDKIQTSNGEVIIPNIPARTAFDKGLVEGWKAGYKQAAYTCLLVKIDEAIKSFEFIEGEE